MRNIPAFGNQKPKDVNSVTGWIWKHWDLDWLCPKIISLPDSIPYLLQFPFLLSNPIQSSPVNTAAMAAAGANALIRQQDAS